MKRTLFILLLIIVAAIGIHYAKKYSAAQRRYATFYTYKHIAPHGLLQLPIVNFKANDLEWLVPDTGFIELKTFDTGLSSGIQRFTYDTRIDSLGAFISFCQHPRHFIQTNVWLSTFPLNQTPNPKSQTPFLIDWQLVRKSVITGKTDGLDYYSLDLQHRDYQYYHIVAFSNGVVYVSACRRI